ncbi:Lead, cadmium, zinc and mercury transporting ATPase [Legionella beliardensis]|uniref:Lead, cadmium, zinc and mercury transporting ATPase n=1 Tax=Legionella beliardensis TaxID=91822 RepID=A0A378I6K7_9GAMM|nr:HAD-IC family P-type ATPase [Legionella beliardensis]STX28094.1 Lead, cadmium, zinc and mercury transporting ATPase [Legionella beliardensis]
MKKKIIFQDSFLVSGIMCPENCGSTIETLLHSCIDECIETKLLPADAKLIIYSEPSVLGTHYYTITIQSEADNFFKADNFHTILSAKIKEDIAFEVIDNPKEQQNNLHNKTNWINILINLIALGAVTTLALIFPPSILLTVGLTAFSFLTTAFTARDYLINFFRNLRTKNVVNMSTTISLGWFLSLAHTLFHSISMPLASSFSMIFMNFMMPIMLITCINGMDELKRLIFEKSKKIQLKGIKTLFPQMAEKYRCYQLSEMDELALQSHMNVILNQQSQIVSEAVPLNEGDDDKASFIQKILTTAETREEQKKLLTKGMIIEVKPGECFPVDCILIQGNTIIDASLLTGEPQQSKQLWQNIPAGAVNLGQAVTVYATKAAYNSTVNNLLLRANRARNTSTPAAVPQFAYLYTALIIIGLIGAIVTPAAFGLLPFILPNVIGFLFSLCPCTITIAHQLPSLLSIFYRSKKGIHLRDESLLSTQSDEIHTIVFDKTGTLTTGNSVVESSDIPINSPLWQRIYLLEKAYGREHPLAKAIKKHYEVNATGQVLFDEIKDCKIDEKNRGFTARVQEKVIQIGSAAYLKNNNILLPEINNSKIEQGFSAVYVAEDGVYKGVIYIKHEVRKGIVEALARLKSEGKKIIMLTGDNYLSAIGFNKQINSVFAEEDIHAGQTPKDKELFLTNLINTPGINPKGVCFVGDGLNDAPCCRVAPLSCAMESSDKTAFFTDICLNGSLDYLFKHNQLNRSLKQNIAQNQGILIYSTLAFLAFIISFSIAGIAVSPLIPMGIMLSTTLFVLFNSYRTQLVIDNTLDDAVSWPKKLLGSNLSIGLLLGASTLLICSVLAATIATGGLALPMIAFTTAVAAFSSVCTLSAIGLLSTFAILFATSLLSEQGHSVTNDEPSLTSKEDLSAQALITDRPVISEELNHRSFIFDKCVKNNINQRPDIAEEIVSNGFVV